MNANAIAIGTPSGDRYIRAASKFAFGDVNCFARIPPVLAGDRRKILGGTGWGNTAGSRSHPIEFAHADQRDDGAGDPGAAGVSEAGSGVAWSRSHQGHQAS